MTAKEFVALWKMDKDRAMATYLGRGASTKSAVGAIVAKMKLNRPQRALMRKTVDFLLTDTYYSLLLGLDGCNPIGSKQLTYMIFGEDGNLISDCGEIEGEAYEAFHGNSGRALARSPVPPPKHPKNLYTERWKRPKSRRAD